MDTVQLAAQFAAYTWYSECRVARPDTWQASRFAQENWQAFLDMAPEGFGRLLIRIGRLHPKRSRTRRHAKAELQAVG
jgi:hypothetical protein